MGNNNSALTLDRKVVATDYRLVGKNNSIRWGELFEMKNIKTGQMVLMQEKHALNVDTHRKTLEECTYRISLTHNNLITVYGFAGGDGPDAFTNTYKVCVFFEHAVNNLKKMIKARRGSFTNKQNHSFQYFDENELLRFMNQLADVLCFLQRNGICQGDITPDVSLVSKEGNVKVLDRKLIYNDKSAFHMAQEGNHNVFLTPTELGALASDGPKPVENRYKADVFRLGMTLLECATLQRSSQIYDWKNYTVSLDVLSSRLIEAKERYSSTFYDPLREMLRFEEDKRPDFIVLNQYLQEESAQNFSANVSQVCKEEEVVDLRKSVSGIGPKLVTNVPMKGEMSPPRRNFPSRGHSQDMKKSNGNFQSAFAERLERKQNEAGKIEKKDEDIEDDVTEFDSDIKVNAVPYTEPRLSVEMSRTPAGSPAKRLQKLITDKNVLSNSEKTVTPEATALRQSVTATPSTTNKNKFALSLKDFFRRNSPSKEGNNHESSFSVNNKNQEEKRYEITDSPKITFGETSLPSTNRNHKRVASGAPSYSGNQYSEDQSVINIARSIKCTDSHQDSFSSSFDQPSKPFNSNNTQNTKVPGPVLSLSGQLHNKHFVLTSTPQHTENGSISEFYSVSSNPPTQRTNPAYPFFHSANIEPYAVNNNYGAMATETRPLASQFRSRSSPKHTNMGQILKVNQLVQEEVMKRTQMSANPDMNEQELVDNILRRVLNSAGISPHRPMDSASYENNAPLGFAKPRSLIRPTHVEMNENVDWTKEEERQQAYYSGGFYSKQAPMPNTEKKVHVRPLEDQFTQAIEPRSMISPKFGVKLMGDSQIKAYKPKTSESVGGYDDLGFTKGGIGKGFGFENGREQSNTPTRTNNVVGDQEMKVEDRFELAMERSRRSRGYMKDLATKLNRGSSRTTSIEPNAREVERPMMVTAYFSTSGN